MTNTPQNPITCPSRGHKDLVLHTLEVEAKLEDLDRQEGHEYVPMDVFLDRRTIKEHFQSSSIRARWVRMH